MWRKINNTFLLDYKFDKTTIYQLYIKLHRERFKKLYWISTETYHLYFGNRYRRNKEIDYTQIDNILSNSDNIRIMQKLIQEYWISIFANQ